MRDALAARPEGKRRKAEYKQVINAYYEVYHFNPASGKAAAALAAIAELDREMGNVFSSDSYFLQSIKAYHFLRDQYPHSRIAHEGMFTIGEIFRQDLEDPEEARRAFQGFLAAYPRSDKAGMARDILKQLSQQHSQQTKTRPAVRAAAAAPLIEEVTDGPASGPRQVTAVRRWVGPNYLRIVIEVDGEAKFESVRLSNPDRIVVNLQTARLSPELIGKTFPVENGFLRQIRVAQFSPDVSRVVLDVEKIESYSIFSLPNPFRLVIDVEGIARTQMARTVIPVAPPADAQGHKTGGHKTERPAAALPSNPEPTGPAAAAKTAPPPDSVQITDETEPSNPETASVHPAASKKSTRKSKGTTESADVSPAIQAAAPTETRSRTLTRALGLKIGRIVIDPGHGGHDTGTIGPTGLEEKEVVLDVGLKLKKLLEHNTGCEVVMTRSDDTFIPLEERTAIANRKGRGFVHLDSCQCQPR